MNIDPKVFQTKKFQLINLQNEFQVEIVIDDKVAYDIIKPNKSFKE